MKFMRKIIATLVSCSMMSLIGVQAIANSVETSPLISDSETTNPTANILITEYDNNTNTVTISSTDPTYGAYSRCEYYNEAVPEIIHLDDLGNIKIDQNGTYHFTVCTEDGLSRYETSLTIVDIKELGNRPQIKEVYVEYTSSKTSAKITVKAVCSDKIVGYSDDNGLTWQTCNYFIVNGNSEFSIIVKSNKNAKSEPYVVSVAEIDTTTVSHKTSGSVTDSIKVVDIAALNNAGILSTYDIGDTIESPGKITVSYSDGSTSEMFVTEDMLIYDFSKRGNTEVMIRYGGKEIKIPTTVTYSSPSGGYWSDIWDEESQVFTPTPTLSVTTQSPKPSPQVSEEPVVPPSGDLIDNLHKEPESKIPSQIPSYIPEQNITYAENFIKGIRVNAGNKNSSTFIKDTDYLPFILPAGKVDVGKITTNETAVVAVEEGITVVNVSSLQSKITGDLLGIKLISKTSDYSDVIPNAWYYSNIMQASSSGFLKGTSNTGFSPKLKLTTKDTITALNRVMVKNQDFYMATPRIYIEQILNEMQKDEIYYNRANILSKMKSSDIEDALAVIEVAENTLITREQLAQLLYNIYNNVLPASGSDRSFSDTNSPYVSYCVKAGLLQGKSDSKFDPKANLTRAELAVVLIRLNELYSQSKGLLQQ